MAVVMLLAFVLGAGLVGGIYFAIVRLPGMMAQRKLDARPAGVGSECAILPERRTPSVRRRG